MYDYGYGYGTPSYDTGASVLGGLFASMGLMMLISSAVSILVIISQWKIYKKAGKNGWECLIPIYNIIVLLEIVGLPKWYIALFFVPFANIYASFKIFIELAHKFGKSTGFGVLTAIFSPICLPILAFGKDNIYGGTNTQVNPSNNMVSPTNNTNNINNMNNFQNVAGPQMFNQPMNQNINPMPIETPQQFVNPNTTIPTPVAPAVPTPVVTSELSNNFNQQLQMAQPVMDTQVANQIPAEPVIPTPVVTPEPVVNFGTPIQPVMETSTVAQMPETRFNQNATQVMTESAIANPVNTVPEPVTMINEPQVIPQETVMNNPMNNFNQDNNQNM